MSGEGSLLVGSPDSGSVEVVAELAAAVGREGDWRVWQAGVVRRALDELAGQGHTVEAVRERLAEMAARLDDLGAVCAQVREIVGGYAGELSDLQTRARRLREWESEAIEQAVRHRTIVLEGDPTVGRPPWQAPPVRRVLRDEDVAWALSRWQEAVADHQDITRAWGVLVDDRESLDQYAAGRLDGVPELDALRTRVPGANTSGAVIVAAALWADPAALVHADDLAALGDASAVREVWDQLTDAQRQWLVSSESSVIGNLDGIPIQFRAQANRVNMQAEIARIDRVLAAEGTSSINNQLRAGETVDDLRALRKEYMHYLNSPQTVFDENGDPTTVIGVPVVVFDPESAAIATYRGPFDALGDVPAWIANVVIHVPGTGTTLAKFRGTDKRAVDLYKGASALIKDQGAGPTAVFAWAGGRFPQKLEAAHAGFSRTLGPRLRDFAAAVDTHPASSTLTVTGHSYGAAVVGIAEAKGLRADRIVYVSGAGIGNDNTKVADFPHTGGVPHYALMARNDAMVGYIQGADLGDLGHGASPLHDPDVVRLETGFLNDARRVQGQDIESLGPMDSHSGVYRVGSTSFKNIVQTIVGGRVETYARDELRVEPLMSWPVGRSHVRTIDGIDRDDYVPHHTAVK